MTKVFLKDMLDRRTILKYFVGLVLIYTGMDFLINKDPNLLSINFDLRLVLFVCFALFTTIFYFAKTYTSTENTLLYYQLPVKRKKINLSFILSLIIDSLIRKFLPLAVIAYVLKAPIEFYPIILLMLPIICMLGSLPSSSDIRGDKKLIVSLLLIGSIALILFLFYKTSLSIGMKALISILAIFILVIILGKFYLNQAIFSQQEMGSNRKFRISNYFLKFILAENVYLINTVGIILMIIFVSIMMPGAIKVPLALAIATVNTPLLTILSTDKGLATYKKMLPKSNKSLDKDYIKILFIYFALVHLIVLLANRGQMSVKFVIGLIAFTIFDTLVAYFMENKYPIVGKKTTMEVWKSPRKYILGAVVFILSFVIFVII
ncbi:MULTISPECIES: hypothetical protein [Anaerococcus]|uniref:Uncharacterized protein n=1 Tax=Anaerococcus octavius TaxID=54007 RepID=A0A2I1MAW2_9FIRM|nr:MULTISPECIES: hypothetical protein [Anaerococcus]MBS6105488.1 hypothetical protein [Anaerococcus sp.]PKZ17274.1 hypothetical protein CYJ34_00775 [Anaerococcus octavius]